MTDTHTDIQTDRETKFLEKISNFFNFLKRFPVFFIFICDERQTYRHTDRQTDKIFCGYDKKHKIIYHSASSKYIEMYNTQIDKY